MKQKPLPSGSGFFLLQIKSKYLAVSINSCNFACKYNPLR